MPKTLADKPPKYGHCDAHSKRWKDVFCCDHKELVCPMCSDTDHKICLTKTVDDLCKTIQFSETDALCDAVKKLNDKTKFLKDAIETDIEDLAEHRNHLMQETKTLHESVISKVNERFQDIQSKTADEYQFQYEQLKESKEKINNINTRVRVALDETKMLKGKPFDAKLFLKVYEDVQVINQTTDEFRTLNQSRRLLSLSFDHSNLVKEIMSDSAAFGSLKREKFKPDAIEVKDITFPQSVSSNTQSVEVNGRAKVNKQGLPLPVQAIGNPSQITATISNSAVASSQS